MKNFLGVTCSLLSVMLLATACQPMVTPPEKYTICFYNDKEIIQTYELEKGESLSETPTAPSKAKDGNYLYCFDKWVTSFDTREEPNFQNISGDLDVYALYSRVKTFENENVDLGYYAYVEKSFDQTTQTILLPDLQGNITEILTEQNLPLSGYTQKGECLEVNENFVGSVVGDAPYGDFSLFVKTQGQNVEFFYEIKLAVVTMIINDAEDLEKMQTVATVGAETDAGDSYAALPLKADGYYILNNNIDYNGEDFGLTRGTGGSGFIGVFDGNGYTIRNIAVKYESAGLFGQVGETGVVKNISFIGVTNVTNKANCSYVRRVFITFVCRGTLENVYVEGLRGRIYGLAPFSGVIGQYQKGAIVKNLVAYITEDSDKNHQDYIGTAIGTMMGNAKVGDVQNIISISEHYDAIGVNPDGDYGQSVFDVESYRTMTAVKGAKNTYDSEIWNTDIWEISGALPVFRTSNLLY